MRPFAATAVILAGLLTTGACLRTQTTHLLYLSPSGAVTWTVREHDVHSDDQDGSKRAREESDFLRAVGDRSHAPLLALEAVGGRGASTELIRTERPWEAVTTARFDRIDTLFASILRDLGLEGTATLSTAGGRSTLLIQWTEKDAANGDSAVLALVEDIDAYRVVLTEGYFVAADGFTISPDGRSATVIEEVAPAAERRVSLTWMAAAGR